MPWRMEQALNVLPPSKDHHMVVRTALARRGLAPTRGATRIPWREPTNALPPSKSKILTKLFENSRKLFSDPDTKLACMYDRMVLAGRGTPVDKETSVSKIFPNRKPTFIVMVGTNSVWSGVANTMEEFLHANTFSTDLTELLKAPTCCRYHWLQYQAGKRRLIGAVLPYEDPFIPPTPASKALQNLSKPDQLSRRVWHDLNTNARVQATMSTVNVRWHRLRNDLGYDEPSLYTALRPYGEIDIIHRTGPLSARVTFSDLQAACHAVAAHSLGRLENPLLCLWYHKSMRNKGFYIRRRHLHVSIDPFAT